MKVGICCIAVNDNSIIGYIRRDSDCYRVFTSGNVFIEEYELLLNEYEINPEAISRLECCFRKLNPFKIIMETDTSLSGHKFNLYILEYDIDGSLIDCYYKNTKNEERYSLLFPQNNECFIKYGEVYTYD